MCLDSLNCPQCLIRRRHTLIGGASMWKTPPDARAAKGGPGFDHVVMLMKIDGLTCLSRYLTDSQWIGHESRAAQRAATDELGSERPALGPCSGRSGERRRKQRRAVQQGQPSPGRQVSEAMLEAKPSPIDWAVSHCPEVQNGQNSHPPSPHLPQGTKPRGPLESIKRSRKWAKTKPNEAKTKPNEPAERSNEVL
jgi:hypothetical protein